MVAHIKAREIARGLRSEGVAGRNKRAVLASRTWGDLQEALDAGARGEVGGIRPEDFSLRDLAANTIFSRNGDPVGHSFVEEFFAPEGGEGFQEAMGAVESSAFAGITGQLIINRILESYNAEEFVASKLVPTIPTRLNGERIPGVSMPADPGEGYVVSAENQPLQYVGFNEDYVETPATVERKVGIAVTKTLVFFDRTGLVLQNAGKVGTILGLRKEKNILLTMIGANNSYVEKRRGDSAGVSLATFYSAVDAGRWVNHLDNNPLADWSNIDASEATFANTKDPDTGEPIILPGTRLLFAPQLKFLQLNQLLGATQVAKATQGGLAPAAGVVGVLTTGNNPLQKLEITMATSRQLYAQLQIGLGISATDAQGYWFYGDPTAFAYMENWPITITQAPSNSEAEFTNGVIARFKAEERGIPAIIEPRRWQRNRGNLPLATPGSSGDDASSSSSGATLPVLV